jgi:hypothetical protein
MNYVIPFSIGFTSSYIGFMSVYVAWRFFENSID